MECADHNEQSIIAAWHADNCRTGTGSGCHKNVTGHCREVRKTTLDTVRHCIPRRGSNPALHDPS